MKKQWIFPTEQKEGSLVGVSAPVAGILAVRGIGDPQEFLSDKPKTAHDPFCMKGMEEVAEKLLDAIEAGKKICVYGDYDCDGICSVALLTEIFEKMGAKVSHYIPSRFAEGYGVNKGALAKIAANGAKLVLTCDCGITSAEEIRFAKMLGMDVIVTDHHTPGSELPDCLILNPKQEGCGYPEKGLCGAGVSFKLAQALSLRSLERGASGHLIPLERKDLLAVMDLAAIATVGDIVPLRGENRTIVKFGMQILNRNPRPFVTALREVAHLPEQLTGDSIAYGIVPRLNAAGRVGTAEDGLRLIRAGNAAEARTCAEVIDAENTKRKQLQEETFQNTLSLVRPDALPPVLFLLDEKAHEGILGIAAGKLKDLFGHPVILFTQSEDGAYKGSGRSPEGIDLYDLLAKGKHLYTHFGGHKGACGLTIPKENFGEAKALIEGEGAILYGEHPEAFRPTLVIDWVLKPAEVTLGLTDDLERMSPFGADNPEPLFCMRSVAAEDPGLMGQGGQHIRFRVNGVPCVLFNCTQDQKQLIFSGKPLDIAGMPAKNAWKDRVTVQFRVQDIQEG